jgi:hypothetical protein
MTHPWLKFYPSDWRADPCLRMCSIGARGLWVEMLCLMHEATPYGSLRVNGKALTDSQLAGLAGVSADDAATYLGELEAAGVFSRKDDGAIYSRRMERDEQKATADRTNGKRGGNPNIVRGVNPPVNGVDKAQIPEARDQKDSEEASASSGATAPQALPGQPEIKDRIWLELPAPLAVLGGKTEAQVRTFLGKALKVHDPPAVYTAGLAALQSKSGDPFAYIVRVLAPTAARKNTHAGKAESLSDRARSIADKLRAAEQSVPPIGGGGPGGYPPRLLSDRRGG